MTVEKMLILGLGIMVVLYLIVLVKDLMEQKKANSFEDETNLAAVTGIGAVINFGDTLGIGSFAVGTALLRAFKQIDDRVLPGTLNVSNTLPIIYQAYLFIGGVSVDPITLVTMIAASILGAYVGAGIVSKLPTKRIQLIMAMALAVTGVLVVLQLVGLFPTGGEAIGLTGATLIIAIAGNFILGALMTAGIGLYAPCMALVFLLGMNPIVAFPIMMGSCAYLMPVASFKFIKDNAYNKKCAIGIGLGGLVGVHIAYTFVQGLDLTLLKILVVCVMAFTSFSLYRAATKRAM